jgi:hypothetical protein
VWLSVLFFGGLVIAFATVLCAWPWRGPATQYAPIQWNRDSWAANLALAGSALVAFTSLVAPTAVFHYMTRAEYGSLAALLTGAVALATAGYAFLGVARLVLGVLLTVTLGAAVSQLLTLGLLVAEARRLLVLRIEVYLAIQVLVVSTVVALVVYGYRTILDIGKATTRVAEERVMAERPLHLP